MSSARERMMAAKAKREQDLIKKEQDLIEIEEKKRIAAEKRKKKAAEAKEERNRLEKLKNPDNYMVQPKPKQTVNLEIDYNEFKKIIATQNIAGTNPDANLVYRICFKPYYKNSKLSNRGRQEALTEAIFRVLQSNAIKLVKKVIREDII